MTEEHPPHRKEQYGFPDSYTDNLDSVKEYSNQEDNTLDEMVDRLGSIEGEPQYQPKYDLNSNGMIDRADLKHFIHINDINQTIEEILDGGKQ